MKGVSGTPAFFVNGQPLQGAQPYEVFHGVVEAKMNEAKALLRRGVRRQDIYDRAVGAKGIRQK